MNNNWMFWMFTLAATVLPALVAGGCETMRKTGNDDDRGAKEQEVSMDQLPAAVKATLMKETGNAKIEEIDKQMMRGRTVYEADVMLDGKKWEIMVREDGQLLKKQLDEETDEEDEKNGKEDDDDDRK